MLNGRDPRIDFFRGLALIFIFWDHVPHNPLGLITLRDAETGEHLLVDTHDAAFRHRFAAVAALIAEWQPQALVIGIPYHPDGAAHENTRRATNFGRQLSQRFKLPVYTVDERYSTTEALASGAADADATAACIILEQFFNTLP